MIERKFVAEKVKEFKVKTHINKILQKAGQSGVKIKKTPLGDKVIIAASKPGLIVGRKGENIKKLTNSLKEKFGLENPQIEIEEIQDARLDPVVVAERVATTLERFGSGRFKHTGHRVLSDIMAAGALGAEITISGKIPSSRAKTWRFNQGYLKKSGDVSHSIVRKADTTAELKTGTIGIKVRILPKVRLPDYIELKTVSDILTEEIKSELKEKTKENKKVVKKATKKISKKKTVKKFAKTGSKENPAESEIVKKKVEKELIEESKVESKIEQEEKEVKKEIEKDKEDLKEKKGEGQ